MGEVSTTQKGRILSFWSYRRCLPLFRRCCFSSSCFWMVLFFLLSLWVVLPSSLAFGYRCFVSSAVSAMVCVPLQGLIPVYKIIFVNICVEEGSEKRSSMVRQSKEKGEATSPQRKSATPTTRRFWEASTPSPTERGWTEHHRKKERTKKHDLQNGRGEGSTGPEFCDRNGNRAQKSSNLVSSVLVCLSCLFIDCVFALGRVSGRSFFVHRVSCCCFLFCRALSPISLLRGLVSPVVVLLLFMVLWAVVQW